MSALEIILALVGVLLVVPFVLRQQLPIKKEKLWMVAILSFLLALTGLAASYFFSFYIGLLILITLTGATGYLFVNSLKIVTARPVFEPQYQSFQKPFQAPFTEEIEEVRNEPVSSVNLQVPEPEFIISEDTDFLTDRASAPFESSSSLLEDDYIPELSYVSTKENEIEIDFEELLKKTDLVKGGS
ncbi:hypothetical protein [Metabacillus idriensis]|uniref:hypothetical protein n=1 Tax=Metabacillus idriensis TaxID=324768 RepID=UPI001748AB6C|nr:hypothetical protein [Metabacillus idriensis]